jgi:crotonobetainyl-CoA:carnitine CoA-transferase CaiB-like acyl-CoA transferase
LGAEVIKLEERVGGDPGRGVLSIAGAMVGATSGPNFYFEANNRHKKSLTLDLKKPEALEIVYKLIEKSDVFVQNFRKGVADRLGLGYEKFKQRNPKIIYASATGYGPFGPDSAEPSFDYMGLARSGIMTVAGEPDMPPLNITGGIADQMGAIMLSYGILAALIARDKYGVGQQVDSSHLGSMTALQGLNVSCKTILGKEFKRMPRAAAPSPLWNHYQCGDGKWICLAMAQQDRYWKDFCKVLGVSEVATDPRFDTMAKRAENAKDLVPILDKAFAAKPRDYWMQALKKGGDFIYTVVNSIDDLTRDEQMIENEYIVDYEHPRIGKTKLVGFPLRLSETPADPRGAAPEFGEHTEMILTELLGYSWEDVGRFREAEII